MDKKLVLAVAGSGKTTYIVDSFCKCNYKTLIVTYTDANYDNIIRKIRTCNNGTIPNNIRVYTYFKFLYSFCYKPFLADRVGARGINYNSNPNRYIRSNKKEYYLDPNKRLYSNRISYLIEQAEIIIDVKQRIEKYFDYFVIDEIQDIGGRDFNLIEALIDTNVNMLFVGDFYQHTFSTSNDGNVNSSLYSDYKKYIQKYTQKGVEADMSLLVNSWRCGKQVCDFVREKLGIEIFSNNGNTGEIKLVEELSEIKEIWNNPQVIKLHYQNSSKFGEYHKNWGETKGEDCYYDVCVLLNKSTMEAFRNNSLKDIAVTTRNRLYVAITRARGNVYFIEESVAVK